MGKRNRHLYHHDKRLYSKLKWTIIAIILLPVLMLAIFVFFGPQVGELFGIVSINKNSTNKQDVIAPPIPIFDNPPKATNISSVEIKGYGEPGSVVQLFVNGPEYGENIVTTDGTFVFNKVPLVVGNNTVFSKAYDKDKNESGKSVVLSILYDIEKPEITIESPKEGEVIRNLNERVFIKGEISEKASITINNRIAVLKPDLTFEFPMGVVEGWTEITIVAVDEAQNKTTRDFKFQYVRGSN